MIRRACVLLFVAFAWLGAIPPDASAEPSLMGTWDIVEAAHAPWTAPTEHAALAAEGRRMLKLAITFAPGTVNSKHKAFSCARGVIYEANSLEADSIFQGNLPEPNPTAAALRMGFAKGEIPSVDVRCIKAQYSFHFRDPNTVLFALNNVIYTLKRR
jgi:hypothetical protein